MLDRIKQDVVKVVLTVQVRTQEDVQAVEEAPAGQQRAATSTPTTSEALGDTTRRRRDDTAVAVRLRRRSCAPASKVGRNDPCPCGSGKKYKHCHGRLG